MPVSKTMFNNTVKIPKNVLNHAGNPQLFGSFPPAQQKTYPPGSTPLVPSFSGVGFQGSVKPLLGELFSNPFTTAATF